MGAMRPLIGVEELRALLDEPGGRILDARSSPGAEIAYEEGHLPGAVHALLDRDLAAPAPHPERGGRHPLPPIERWAATLGGWGIRPDTHVVIYDDQSGAMAAARAWWMLRAVGHEKVQVLDGGLAAAKDAGLPLVTGSVAVTTARPYPVTSWLLPTADVEEVDRAREDPGRRVVDVRAAFRYLGWREPIDPVAGHIPGAINVPYSANLDGAGRYFRAPAELREHYRRELGGVPAERAIIQCGSGVTACHTLLALEHAGLPGASLYVGSWGEWCRQPERPRAAEEEPKEDA